MMSTSPGDGKPVHTCSLLINLRSMSEQSPLDVTQRI